MSEKKLGIIAGSGRLPVLIAESCKNSNRPYFVLALEGHADASLQSSPHKTIRLGAVGDALKTLKKEQVEQVIMAGGVKRPSLASLRPDITATMLLAKLGSGLFSGDDALLSAIIKLMEQEGFEVMGAEQVIPHLLTQTGTLGKHKPTKQQLDDIASGMKAAKALGALDLGQAAIVENGYVLALEDAEGTEQLIARASKMPQHQKGNGILVKAKKPTQDARADLPTIGTDTVTQVVAAGFVGIAVEAGGSFILDSEDAIKAADESGIFIVGAAHE